MMKTFLCLWFQVIVVGALPQVVEALTPEEALTEAILDMTTTERRHLWWRPCGERFRGRDPEAREYARGLASTILDAAGDDLDPWWMAAQLMQESGMNPCIFSSREFARYRRALGRRPDRRDVLRLLTRPALRQQYEIRAMDAGLAQFRWPGAVARRVGIDAPEELLDTTTNVEAFAAALRLYRSECEDTPVIAGTTTVGRGDRVRVRRYRYACEDVFWAIHNSGSVDTIRHQYIQNVRRRYRRGPEKWRERVTSTPDGET